MKYLITGGCGFLGSNIASSLLLQGEEVALYDNLSRMGGDKNLAWLRQQGDLHFVHGDIRDPFQVSTMVTDYQPDVIFHLAGQVAMTTSIANPRLDFEVNAMGTLNVLEAVRQHAPNCVVIYSSTNKVYGDLENVNYKEGEMRYEMPEYPDGFSEASPLDFHSPYGCSKGTADQYMIDYHRIFGLNTVVFRHSSMYGGRQFATFDQGWIGWFCQKAMNIRDGLANESFTISGNGKQVRDLLHADDMVQLYLGATQHIEKLSGQAFNVGGGMPNSLSLLELFSLIEKEMNIKMIYRKLPPRVSDQKIFVANIAKINAAIDWQPQVDKVTGIRKMLEWVVS